MLAPVLIIAALAAAAPSAGTYRGVTSEGRPITLTVAHGKVARVSVDVGDYRCDLEGDIGPLAVRSALGARIGSSGMFGATAGPTSERTRIDGRFARSARVVRGSLRVRGTVGTGEPCRSPRIAFSARRAR